jgi:L-threonylcarbamoyladenylate synthase
MIHAESLRATMGDSGALMADDESEEGANKPLRSPGRLLKHYSPRARLEILSWQDDEDLRLQIAKHHWPPGKVHIIAHTVVPSGGGFGRVSVIPHDAEAFARAIYAELHLCDEAGAERIIVESLPATNEWRAIADRLKRAAG